MIAMLAFSDSQLRTLAGAFNSLGSTRDRASETRTSGLRIVTPGVTPNPSLGPKLASPRGFEPRTP